MTREFINRILSQLFDHQIEFVVTGSIANYLRGDAVSTMDLDIVVKTDERNLNYLDKFGGKYQSISKKISKDLEKGKIVRIKAFPFGFDLLPRLDGLNKEDIFRNKEQIQFEGFSVPLISKSDLDKNYKSFNQI